MYSILVYLLMIIGFLIILSQPSNQQDALSLLFIDKSDRLFETQKSRGVSYLLQYVTTILGIIWLVFCIYQENFCFSESLIFLFIFSLNLNLINKQLKKLKLYASVELLILINRVTYKPY